MEEFLLNNKSKYDPMLFEAFVNLYKRCKYNPRILPKTYNNEHCSHYYSKYQMKDWLEKKYPDMYGIIEYPIFKGSEKKNIVKELGFNPTCSDIMVLLNKNYLARVDLVLFDKETDEPTMFIEVVNTSACTAEKIERMNSLGITNLFEIDCNYIMKKKKDYIPEDLMDNMKTIL